jgi:TRAP-type C4-dicarboxylate transport system permease small subunit
MSSTTIGWLADNKYARNLVQFSQNFELYLMYVFYVFMLFVVIVEVFRRYGLSMSSLWSSEAARYSFLYLTYLGISWAVYQRVHIRITAIYDLVSDRVEGYLYLLSDVVLFLFGAYAIWYTIPLIQTSLEFNSLTQALRINRAFAQFAIPTGMGLMMIRVVQRTYYDIKDVRAGRQPYQGENVFADTLEEEAAKLEEEQ